MGTRNLIRLLRQLTTREIGDNEFSIKLSTINDSTAATGATRLSRAQVIPDGWIHTVRQVGFGCQGFVSQSISLTFEKKSWKLR
jgi:hypothetical protein